jgi:hypothetical protein
MIAIRPTIPADRALLERVAGRDTSSVPGGALLAAFEDGELRAAISLASGESIADPFHPTAHLVAALRAYAGAQPRTRSMPGSYRGSFATSAGSQSPKMPTSTAAPSCTPAGKYA